MVEATPEALFPGASEPGLAEQTRCVAALRQGFTQRQGGAAVQLIETHISFVLIAGDYAYKIKKAVNLGFVDFTTLALRRHFCAEELRLNRRTAPQLYLDVVDVTLDGAGHVELSAPRPTTTSAAPRGGLSSPAEPDLLKGGARRTIDVALKMRAFAQDALWDRAVDQGRLEPADIDLLAQSLCALHRDAAVAARESEYGAPQQLRTPMRETLDALDQLPGDSDRACVAALRAWEARAWRALERHIAQRCSAGHVRECHGDLHLGNVVTLNREPVMFDCLEFNPAYRWTDVMSDVAFLAMDLMRHARSDLAHRFVNTTLEASGDYEGARVLRYHLVYRALVRAKVAALRAAQRAGAPPSGAGEPEGQQVPRPPGTPVAADAQTLAYLGVAQACSARVRPVLFITHGVSGTGKTTGTGVLLERIGAIRIRADIERKRLARLTPLAKSASALREGLYSPARTAATHEHLRQAAKCVLHGGWHAILDATFLQREQRDQARELARRLGVRLIVLHFEADAATLRRRIVARAEQGADASEAGVDVVKDQIAHLEPLGADEGAATFTIDTGPIRTAEDWAAAWAPLCTELELQRR